MDLNNIPSGYMLFVRVASKWYNEYKGPDVALYKWGLREEFHLPFLGTVSKLWSMLTSIEKSRWNILCNDEYMSLMSYTTLDSLVAELHEHIRSVLYQTLLSHNLTPHT